MDATKTQQISDAFHGLIQEGIAEKRERKEVQASLIERAWQVLSHFGIVRDEGQLTYILGFISLIYTFPDNKNRVGVFNNHGESCSIRFGN